MKKLDSQQCADYWRNIHSTTDNDLAVVCFPNKPLYFNLFFDRVEKYALTKYFSYEKIEIARKRILDLGCGQGRWLSLFEKRYHAVAIGLDLSEHAIQACKRKGLKAYLASITQIPFENDYFDFVSSIAVLLHLPDDLKEKTVAEIFRVLKPGGKVIMIESTWQDDPSPHVYGLTMAQWEALFNKHNMKLSHKSGHCFNLFRRKLPAFIPLRDFVSIHLDYPLEYGLMNYFFNRQSSLGLQHLMVFEK